MIAIIGAGLTGLSTAFHLKDLPCTVFDKESTVGGLCRSVDQNGFTFDYTGHLLHIRDPYVLDLIQRLLPDTFTRIVRRAAVFTRNRYLPYPFQANLNGLPKKIVLKCVGNLAVKKIINRRAAALNFRDWVLETFGAGISQEFLIPYNQKLYRTPLERMTRTWALWSIPRPSLAAVIRGALGITNIGMGYNASFYYPRKGGIAILPQTLAGQVQHIRLNRDLVSIDPAKKELAFSDGAVHPYQDLVSTLPLPRLLQKITGLPDRFKNAAQKLQYVSVQNLNIGIRGNSTTDLHWTYFPEAGYPFYRVGCYSNISPALAPPGTRSYYVEISSLPDQKKSEAEITAQALNGLQACGLLKADDEILEKKYLDIEFAYVVHDSSREIMLPEILAYLEQQQIFSIGRYGGWTYSAMENAILDGKQTAEKLITRRGGKAHGA